MGKAPRWSVVSRVWPVVQVLRVQVAGFKHRAQVQVAGIRHQGTAARCGVQAPGHSCRVHNGDYMEARVQGHTHLGLGFLIPTGYEARHLPPPTTCVPSASLPAPPATTTLHMMATSH